MFDKLLNKGAEPVAPAAPQRAGAQVAPGASESELQAWRERIAAAKADDQALLKLAHEAPDVELKLAALAALTHEDALKQATREFRDQDKRLYRAAKARWETAVARRQAFAEAPALIATARGLLEQESVPANRLVELDRAWTALNVGAFDETLANEFIAVRALLGVKVREHGEGEQALARWLAATEAAMGALTAGLADLARGAAVATHSAATAGRAAALLQLLNEAPAAARSSDERGAGRIDAANRALALAASVAQRAEFLQSLPAAGAADEAEEKARIEQWREFPEVSDGTLQAVLTHRFTEWHNASSHERQLERDARRTREGEESAQQRKKHLAQLQRQVELAEAAHAGGQVAELTRLMSAIDGALKSGPANAALTRRIDSLRQEQQRLRDWQRWSGGQRREELVAEAQALAGTAGEKLDLKTHADAINKLRERWKELDKLGGATNKALWTAFDSALKAAYVPVAAHLEKLKAQRTENLGARNKLIEGLAETRSKLDPAAPDWRALARSVEDAKIAWRKLGPVEHTVPREAQKGEKAVETRFTAALRALEEPLSQAYKDAGQERERLIAAAKSLTETTPLARDSIDKVRALQAQWQAHAKSLPLPRREENALWTAFKAATDAVFTARDAARSAREAEANAPIKAREAIIDALFALPAESSAAQIKRALADAETAWRSSPRIHGPLAAKLEARWRSARESASKRLRELAERAAQARYDALLAATRLCDEREASPDSPDLEARWSALTDLPAAWKAAMDARFQGKSAAKPQPLPGTLLNLEVALSLDSPPEFEAARRQLKMNALKFAMENRRPDAGASPADIERWLLEAASSPRPDALSRARLEKIVAAAAARK
jgi:exonuclease SbcC